MTDELFNKLNSKFTAYNWNKNSPKSNDKTANKIKDEIAELLKPAINLAELKSLVNNLISDIEADERYHRKPATVFNNAPLALIQTAMEASMGVLKVIKKKLQE